MCHTPDDEWCRSGAQWCVPANLLTNQSVRSWPARSLVPRIRFCSGHHAADVDVADPRGTGSAHRGDLEGRDPGRSLPEPLRPRPISEQTVSSSQASSLDTVHQWSHVPASGLVSSRPVRPRMRCLQLVVRRSDSPLPFLIVRPPGQEGVTGVSLEGIDDSRPHCRGRPSCVTHRDRSCAVLGAAG
jgi:hypothetical protein